MLADHKYTSSRAQKLLGADVDEIELRSNSKLQKKLGISPDELDKNPKAVRHMGAITSALTAPQADRAKGFGLFSKK